MEKNTLRVADYYCGAGGFSEGFRQCGFEIVAGYDSWTLAAETFSLNHKVPPHVFNLARVNEDYRAIEQLPDVEVIIGSPPCVSFSSSNQMGNADKTIGLSLIRAFLRIVAVKRNQSGSVLKAWFFENVPNVEKHLKDAYTFRDLGLSRWAERNGWKPSAIAISAKTTGAVLNAVKFGVPQARLRYFMGEVIGGPTVRELDAQNAFLPTTWSRKLESLADFKFAFLSPFATPDEGFVSDPMYSSIEIKRSDLTDHFYDSGIHEGHARESEWLKTNHPYMGRMSFPENEKRPSRTVIATSFPCSREAIIYKSEAVTTGNGAFRVPTVREGASLMSFPITYQFLGGEKAKWKMVGNAVCPLVAASLARTLASHLGVVVPGPSFAPPLLPDTFIDLRTAVPKSYGPLPPRRRNARFRRHIFKDRTIAVTLANFDLTKNSKPRGNWFAFVVLGTGKNFQIKRVTSKRIALAEKELRKLSQSVRQQIDDLISTILRQLPAEAEEFQAIYENRKHVNGVVGPESILARLGAGITVLPEEKISNECSQVLFNKDSVSVRHLATLIAFKKLVERVNGR